MKPIADMTRLELAGLVSSAFQVADIDVVLSGGSAVTMYSSSKYVSKDLDLVNVYAANHRKIRVVMQELGFQEEGRYFSHEETALFIEFLQVLLRSEMKRSPISRKEKLRRELCALSLQQIV